MGEWLGGQELGHCPNKADEFAGHSGDDNDVLFVLALEMAEASTEPLLGFPREVDDALGLAVMTGAQGGTDPGRQTIVPSGFDQSASAVDVAGFGDAALEAFISGGMFAGN